VPNVTDSQMEAYLQTFHDEYIRAVEQFIPPDERQRLQRYSLLPAKVTGYVSTQFGAGYEYEIGEAELSVRHGSGRIEDLFLGAPAWLARQPPMILVGSGNGIARLTIQDAFPFRLAGERSGLTLSEVSFVAGTWRRIVLYAQLSGNRGEEFWAEAQAVRRARDEVMVALLDLQQGAARGLDLGTYLRTFKARTVLVLGDFTAGRARLEAIRASLVRLGYDAVLLDEVPEDLNYDLQQKFQAVGPVCRFLVFEDSTPSGHLVEMTLAASFNPIAIILREGTSKSTFMTQGLELTSKVAQEWTYEPARFSHRRSCEMG
jgi:hypothetical protein